jgi:hypothetical protein
MNSSSRVKRSTSARPAAAARATSSKDDRITDFSMTRYDMLASTETFDEPLDGLHTRELLSIDVFRHYFGGLTARQ